MAADPFTMTSTDVFSREFIEDLADRVLLFSEEMSGNKLFPYQRDFGHRVVESLILNDGEEITALFSRQSGKTETVADVVAGSMVVLPRIAAMYPQLLGKFSKGLWVGMFAPVESQVETLYQRTVDRLTSERALNIMLDPEIDDRPVGGGKTIRLINSGSLVRMQTANPKAKIESKSYHLAVIDEAQDVDSKMVRKSIHPMLAFYNGTVVKTGTPSTQKGDFYDSIQRNKRRQTARGARKNHFQADWRECAKYNPNYATFVKKEVMRIGEDSDEFRLSYRLEWLLERGMFVTSTLMDALGDKSMEIVRSWWKSPVVVGIDPARKIDSTVVTVLWVDWDRPDEFGYFDHRILNWLEIHGDDWERQYFQVVDFLQNYDCLAIGVDAQGVGDAFAQRLAVLMPRSQVVPLGSSPAEQSKRWKHLLELMQRGMMSWPAHAKVRRLKTYQRFYQQMTDLEKLYQGPYLLAAAPKAPEAHDDYPDSLAIAAALTKDLVMPEVEVSDNPFYARR